MGSHLAKLLSGNGHDITVVDAEPKALSEVASLADVITVEGDSTTFAVLRKASVRKCDLFIAVHHNTARSSRLCDVRRTIDRSITDVDR